MYELSKRILITILRWKIIGQFPKKIKQYVVIAAPHTSWVDFPLGLLIRCFSFQKIHFIGKKTLFNFPHGVFFRWVGGFSIDRSKSDNKVQFLIDKFHENENFILAISPEGTRKKTKKWKTGYYYIAKGAGVPIVKIALDFKNKQVLIDSPFYPTDNFKKDIQEIKKYFKGISGRHPHLS
ncbi:1-acyl-sn-glycerol-3-phosphate acyltransferase [Flavicella sp.]|uniref:1-acyl-sn-glycerol-3-phosphate acyltransferase n=1 Tax=Flavicella sp. TaxID=2957742 RepID=UPI003017FE19